MTISPRRRKKHRRIVIACVLAALALLGGALAWGQRRKTANAAAPKPTPSAMATSAPAEVEPPPQEAAEPPALEVEDTALPAPQATPAPEPLRTPQPTLPLRPSQLSRSLYQAALRVDAKQNTVQGALSLTYVNHDEGTLYALWLHLYPNKALPGSLTILRVSLDGVRAYYTLEGIDGELLRIPLLNELRSGEAARVYIAFEAALPKEGLSAPQNARGVGLNGILPTAAAYDLVWIKDAQMGELEYAPIADYRVLVEAAGVPAGSGSMQQLADGRYYFTADAVAEFALEIGK
ncbi:MAG: hypothetical protein LBN26_01825 [Christensenellaceae bacterium]|nr:hypothetical protein [Christensenellaceae bacterium]